MPPEDPNQPINPPAPDQPVGTTPPDPSVNIPVTSEGLDPAPDPIGAPAPGPVAPVDPAPDPVTPAPDLGPAPVDPSPTPNLEPAPLDPAPAPDLGPAPFDPAPTPGPEPITPSNPGTMPGGPAPGGAPMATGQMPAPAAPNQMGPAPKKKGGMMKIAIIIVVILIVIGGIAALFLGPLDSVFNSTPSYSTLKSVELPGFSGTDSGMRFSVPEEFTEEFKGDTNARYSDKDESGGNLSQVNAQIQTLPVVDDVTKKQRQEIVDSYQSDAFDTEIESALSGDIQDLVISDKSSTPNNKVFTANVEYNARSSADSDEFLPGKGTMQIHIGDRFLYLFVYEALVTVYNDNIDVFNQIGSSVETGLAIEASN